MKNLNRVHFSQLLIPLFLLCSSFVPLMGGIGSVDANGWTILEPSPDSRLVYVSSSEGDDANDGLSPEMPKATIDAANALIRDGFPDWMLLKRGDVFNQPNLGQWKSGRNVSEPMVMTYYGDSGPRPVIKLTGQLVRWIGEARNNLAFVGLDLYRSISDPDSPDFTNSSSSTGFTFHTGQNNAYNLLVEDCRLRYCWMVLQGRTEISEGALYNVHIRRNIIMNNWTHGSTEGDSKIQGLFVRSAVDIVIEENLFHHNGWSEVVTDANANQYNHNIYMSIHNDGEILVRGNIISHGAANGLQLRSGGTAEMNALVGNAIGMNMGYSSPPAHYTGNTFVRDNVVTDGRPQIPNDNTSPQTGALRGIWRQLLNNVPSVDNNIVANVLDDRASNVKPFAGMTANELGTGNIAWNWVSESVPDEDPGWLDPDRNAESYGQSIGLNNWEGFIDAASNRPLKSMPFDLTAYAYTNYVREGFNKDAVLPPFVYDGYDEPDSLNLFLSENSINEGLPIGSLVGILSTNVANDENFDYSLEGGDVESFTIEGNELLTAEVFDYSVKNSYEITIRANDPGGKSALLTVIVNVYGVSISPDSLGLQAGQTGQLDVMVFLPEDSDTMINWISTDEDIATVDSTGLVTGTGPGIAQIIAMIGDSMFSDTAQVVVGSASAEEAVNYLSEVIDREYAGILNNGQRNTLKATLNAALNQIDRGNCTPARNQINAFMNQVNGFVSGGILTQEEGDLLLDQARAILELLEEQCGNNLAFERNINMGDITSKVPESVRLESNFPNPFVHNTQIRLGLPQDSRVTVEVHDIQGRQVALLVHEVLSAGYHNILFEGKDLNNGIYLSRVRVEGPEGDSVVKVHKMIKMTD